MKIDRVHFYVEDARAWRNWFIYKLGFQAVANSSNSHTYTEVIKHGPIYFVLSSPLTPLSPVAQFLHQHPPGVADVTFCVEDVEAVMQQAIAYGVEVLQPIQYQQDYKWARIAAWGSLSHTLVERQSDKEELGELALPHAVGIRGQKGDKEDKEDMWTQIGGGMENSPCPRVSPSGCLLPLLPATPTFTGIDHIVLNVAAGDLEHAVAWYENVLGFRSQQTFKIQTDRSALHSQVMVSRNSCVQFPINQPASPTSQIQEFLNVNQGPGIQHIALQTPNIVQAIARVRSFGVSFLCVPTSYYAQLEKRQGLPLSVPELEKIAQEQILVDWQGTHPNALLLQTFTQPIFAQPTFFFEIIERRFQAAGFGEGNFRALFEAIEREQIKRGNLPEEAGGQEG